VFKYTRHNKWKGKPCSHLNMYGALPASTLKDFLFSYFTSKDPKMLMFDNGQQTVGVYGFKDGDVYIMDPHDWSEKYYTSKREDELDQQMTAEARLDFKERSS